MSKKVLNLLLIGVLFLISSCVDKEYDLVNKEITTDVKLEGNTIALPIGDLKPVLLDSLINADEIDFLKESNGVYSICMDSTISIKESVEPVTFDIAPITHATEINFNDVEIGKVHLNAANFETANFRTPAISLDELNEKLPKLEDVGVDINFNVDDFKDLLDNIKYLPESMRKIPFDQHVSTGERIVPCNIDYELPEQINTIYGIKLGSVNDKNGVLVSVEVNNPVVLKDINKTMNFEIEFPEIFRLAKNDKADQKEKYQISESGNVIAVENFEANGEVSLFSFYITDIVNIDKNIHDGKLDYSGSVKYKIDYSTSGTLELKEGMTVNDFAFNVSLNSKLSFLDATCKIEDIKVDFKPIVMDFDVDFDNLEHIDAIKYVEFDEDDSYIRFNAKITDSDWLKTFKLKEGYALRIAFPKELDIDDELSYYKGKDEGLIKYVPNEHAFYIKDLSLLADNSWNIALSKLTLNKPVTKDPVTGKGVCHVDVVADIQFVDADNNPVEYLMLDGVYLESVVDVLDELSGDKKVDFAMSESYITVKDAVVDTDVIQSPLDNINIPFEFEGEVPAEIAKIEKIGFAEDVDIAINLSVNGLDELDTDINIDADIVLPPFLKLSAADNNQNIVVSEGKLEINNLKFNPSESNSVSVKLLCTGLDFTMLQGGGLSSVDSRISYSSDVVVDGSITVEEDDLHSAILGKNIDFNVCLEMKPITVKMFHGFYNGKINAVEEKIEFDLGEELEFLREEGNSIKLADPQMDLVLTNTVGVPIDVDLQIFGTDENGEGIGEPIVAQLNILPAELDAETDVLKPVQTKLFLTTDAVNNNRGDGYTVVEIKGLAGLLEKVPYNINFKVEPRIVGTSHHVDILKPIELDGRYSVIFPLKFEDLNICYTDTIKGLKGDLGETLKQFTNAAIRLKMTVANTIPLGMSLHVTPMDENGNVLEGLETGNIVVKAGNGGSIMDSDNAENAPEYSYVELSIGSKGGDLSELDKLLFTVNATANSTAGGIGLKAGQGLKILDVVFEVSGDIEFK